MIESLIGVKLSFFDWMSFALPITVVMFIYLFIVLGGLALGASFGFMMPVSTPPNAIVYGFGLVPILTMVKRGIVFDVGGFFIIMAALRVLCPLLGLI